MNVLCIRSSFCNDNKNAILVKKGCYYNVIEVVRGKYNVEYKNDIWYKLLETGKSLHLSNIFVLAPDETEEIKETKVHKVKNVRKEKS